MHVSARFWIPRLVAVCALLTAVSIAQSDPAPLTTVITHVTVINPGSSSVRADQTVLISGQRIIAVGDTSKYKPANDVRVIDATGQYLIPGLWDMHVHSAFGDWFPGGREIILPLFIANGVTGVRDMGGDIPVLRSGARQLRPAKSSGHAWSFPAPCLTDICRTVNCGFPVLCPSPLPRAPLLLWTP